MPERKSAMKQFRLTGKEAVLLKKSATENNLSESGYLRLLLSQKPNDYPEIRGLLNTLTNEINAIGVNINQIVHRHNSRLYSAADREMLSAYMKKLNYLMKEVREKIGNQ